jgi:predicted transcriptional regulator of viral defense system
MERYNLASITQKLYNSGFIFFTRQTFENIIGAEKDVTLFAVIKKLLSAGILKKIERNKYVLIDAQIGDFNLANFFYQPSYVSFESALNFHGILSQFPREVSSATSKKTIRKVYDGKIFVYSRIKKSLFWGFEKQNGILIALPEKAILDQLYLSAKGYKKDCLEDCYLDELNKTRLKEYLKRYPQTGQFKNVFNTLKKRLNL